MTRTVRSAAVLALACLSIPAASAMPSPQEKQDHPLFTRMPGFHIAASEEKEFESYEFPTGRAGDQRTSIEGKFTKLDYRLDKGATKPSALQVIANYTAAVGKIGGTVVFQDKSRATMKVSRDGQEAWAFVNAGAGGSIINLVVVERSVMAQKVMASADIFANDIAATGHVAVYGIYFDVGKADIKPESDAAIGEIAKLLAQSGALKLHVVGHTDNVGDRQMNMTLSRSRAEAVMKVLVSKHGIAASRLSATGVGPYAPVASNRTEDGRAKNRRVELVEQ